MTSKMIVDLDGTLTIEDPDCDYSQKPLNTDVHAALKNAVHEGFVSEILTARNMRTYQGDIGKINKHTLPTIQEWLTKNDVPNDSVIVGKPWPGPNGFYVDDRAILPEDFIYRFGEQKNTCNQIYISDDIIPVIVQEARKIERVFRKGKIIHLSKSEQPENETRTLKSDGSIVSTSILAKNLSSLFEELLAENEPVLVSTGMHLHKILPLAKPDLNIPFQYHYKNIAHVYFPKRPDLEMLKNTIRKIEKPIEGINSIRIG